MTKYEPLFTEEQRERIETLAETMAKNLYEILETVNEDTTFSEAYVAMALANGVVIRALDPERQLFGVDALRILIDYLNIYIKDKQISKLMEDSETIETVEEDTIEEPTYDVEEQL